MGQYRDVINLPAPRVLRADDERLKWDTRVYDAIRYLGARLDGVTGGSGTAADTADLTAPASSLYQPKQVFFGGTLGALAQSARFFFDDDATVYLPRIALEASDSTPGTAPIGFSSASRLLSVLEDSKLENWDPWLYYTSSESDGTLGEDGLPTGASDRTRYQLMGLEPDRDGVAEALIPFGSQNYGVCTTSSALYYAGQGEVLSNYLAAPRLYLTETDGVMATGAAYPPLRLAYSAAQLTAATGGSAAAYSSIPAADVSSWPGAVETDGNFLYWTGSNGTRRALAMHDAAGGGAVSGTGVATRVAFWSAASVLSSSASLYWDNANGFLGVGTTGPGGELHLACSSTTNVDRGLTIEQNSTSTNSARAQFAKSRGSLGSRSTVANGDYVGVIWFRPYVSSSQYMYTAGIGAKVNGTVTSTAAPTELYFHTGSVDDQDPYYNGRVRMVITSDGYVGVGNTAPVGELHVTSTSSSNAERGITLEQVNTGIQSAPLQYRKARGTPASKSTVATGDYVSAHAFKPYVSTSGYIQTASFGARVNGSVTSTSAPTEIFFQTSGGVADSDPYAAGTVRMLISPTGRILIGTSTDSDFLLRTAGDIGPNSDIGYDLGSSTLNWKGLFTRHLFATGGAVPSSATLHANWGASASYAFKTGSKDTAGQIDITPAGAGIAANPEVVITYGNGYSSRTGLPVAVQVSNKTSGATGYPLIIQYSGTTFTVQWVGTPVSGENISIAWHVIGTSMASHAHP